MYNLNITVYFFTYDQKIIFSIFSLYFNKFFCRYMCITSFAIKLSFHCHYLFINYQLMYHFLSVFAYTMIATPLSHIATSIHSGK